MRKKPVRNPCILDQPPHQDAIVANENLVRRALLKMFHNHHSDWHPEWEMNRTCLQKKKPREHLVHTLKGVETKKTKNKQKKTENHMMTFNADHNLMQYD